MNVRRNTLKYDKDVPLEEKDAFDALILCARVFSQFQWVVHPDFSSALYMQQFQEAAHKHEVCTRSQFEKFLKMKNMSKVAKLLLNLLITRKSFY